MHALEVGDQRLAAIEVLLNLGNTRVGRVRRCLGWRARAVDFPRHRHAHARVLREHFVENSRPRARHADDEDRPLDLHSCNLGMRAAPLMNTQAVLEEHQELGARDETAERAQLGFVLERADEAAHAFTKRLPAEIRQAGALARGGEERLFIEAHERNPQTAQTPADRVHRAYSHG